MFGFKKNKKNEGEDLTAAQPAPMEEEADESRVEKINEPPKKKKRFPLKKLIILLIIILVLAGGGFFAFTFFFKDKQNEKAIRAYPETILSHVELPDEILRFCFQKLPATYDHLSEYDKNLGLVEKEIQRIKAIGQKYPDQIKITDREKKGWEKLQKNLIKSFAAVQKTIRELYVSFQVNPDQGNLLITEKKEELAQKANDFLEPTRKQIQKFHKGQKEAPPKGFFAGLIYKVKHLL